jgi:16S rRNA processing protein RimM
VVAGAGAGHERPPARLLRAGFVGAPHGLDGSFHVAVGNHLLLELGGRVMVSGNWRLITRRAGHDRRIILALDGCEDRDGAAALSGSELLVDRSVAPELGVEEWWAEDLEGCRVHDAGTPIGTVMRLVALPSCEVLEVSRPASGDLLVPLVGDAVRTVDIERREIDIDLAFLGETLPLAGGDDPSSVPGREP